MRSSHAHPRPEDVDWPSSNSLLAEARLEMFAAVVHDTEVVQQRAALDGYWAVSRGPLASLAFIVPLLAMYEAGVLGLGPQAVRNGADLWLRGLLDALGFSQYFLLPSLTVGLLLTWHHVSGRAWRIPLNVLPGMAAESLILAFGLVVLAQVQGAACQALGIETQATPVRHTSSQVPEIPPQPLVASVSASGPQPGVCARLIAFLGAGIYEEVLFRLMLLPACVFALARLGVSRARGVVTAIVATSFVFALAHYVGPHGDRWQSFSFLFRLVAGGFFATLFVQRGFGVAAGAHAGYDILVGLC